MPLDFNKDGSRVVNQVLIQLLRSPDFYILLFNHLLRKKIKTFVIYFNLIFKLKQK